MATEKGKRKKRRRETTYQPDNPEQSRKFIEAAKKLGITDGKAFDKAMDSLLKPKGKRGSS